MAYQPKPPGMMGYPNPYYPQYPGYPSPATPGTMQPPYGYPFSAAGFMAGTPGAYGMPGMSGMPGMPGMSGMPVTPGMPPYYMDAGDAGDDEGVDEDEEEEDVDMEMPLDQQSAEKALKHMIYSQLYLEGFDGAKASAVNHLMKELVGFMQDLYQSTQEYGVQGGRSAPNLYDFVAACGERGITAKALKPSRPSGSLNIPPPTITSTSAKASAAPSQPNKKKRKRRKEYKPEHAYLMPRDLSSPEPDLLPSEETPHVPPTLRALQNAPYLPAYPPRHTYTRSAPDPPQRSSLTANLDKRMQNTAKVRAALKNLMDASDHTEEDAGAKKASGANTGEDGKSIAPQYKLTHSSLVNWQESFTMTRKRWKVGK